MNWDSNLRQIAIGRVICVVVRLKKRTWRLIYIITAVLTPPVCALVFLNELTKCENIGQVISLYILEIAVLLLFLPSYKYHYKRPFFIGWILSFCGVVVLTLFSGDWNILGIILTMSVPIAPLLGLALEPFVSKLKYHLLARVICLGLIVLIRFLL